MQHENNSAQIIWQRIDEVRRIAAKVIVTEFVGVRYERDDLIQDAVLRVIKDAHNYDPTKGSLSTFVSAATRFSVYRTLQNDRCKCRKPQGGLRSLDEVIWSSSQVRGRDIRLMDRIEDPIDYNDRCIKRMEYEDVVHLIDKLDARMKHVLYERYIREDKRTFSELAAEMGISRERVRQIEIKALEILRKELLCKGY